MQREQLHQQVIEKIQQCTQQANRALNASLPIPSLSYRLRGKTAGKAYLQTHEIRLNPVLLQENPTEFLQQVIPHEIAHLVVFQLCGKVKPHGVEWQQVMQKVFNLAPETTHRLDISSVQGKTFEYHCQCRTHALTIRRHNKIQRQQAQYHCQLCKQRLVFSGKQLS